MTPWLRWAHRWIALLIGLQVVLWMCSGVAMSLLDADEVKGRAYRAAAASRRPWPADTLPVSEILARGGSGVRAVSSGWLIDEPVYRLSREPQTMLIDARGGGPRVVDAALATRIAVASYRGPGQPGIAELVPTSLETRAHPGPVWRVPFADDRDTTVYVSREGDVLEHRNQSWRLFDLFWMLHIMDYTERKDFNSPWLIGIAIGAFWLSLSGVWLLFTSFRRAEFVPRRWRGTQPVNVYTPEGRMVRTVAATRGDTVFQALAYAGMPLPSNCGGGQSCALCTVRVRGSAPAPTAADRSQLSLPKVRDGHRLACNLAVDSALDIEVRGGVDAVQVHRARVASVRAASAFMREVVLVPEGQVSDRLWPGCFVQLRVPALELSAARIAVPPDFAAEWSVVRMPATWRSRRPLRRAYSLALPPAMAGGAVTLLVRFMHAGSTGAPPGIGSSYVHSLRVGDTVEFTGPHGDFRLQPGHREKFFIGGGAGMSPLRAMVQALLAAGATERIRYWYGARTLRDVPYLEELQELTERHANFRLEVVLSEDDPHGGQGTFETGLVHESARAELEGSASARAGEIEFYVCGPPAMLAATRSMLAALGVPESSVAFDDFKI